MGVILKGYIVVPLNELDMISGHLAVHIELTKAEPGCLKFEVKQRDNSKNIFDVHEEFVDEETFSLHQERVKSSKWGMVSKNVERHYDITGLGAS